MTSSFFQKNGRPWTPCTFVLEKLWKVGPYAKLDKCGFHQFEVEFLSYIISRNGIHMDPRKVQTIVDWATPASIQDVQCFLWFANFYYTLFHNRDPSHSSNSKGSTFFLGSWSWKCLSIFEGFFHDYHTFDSCRPFQTFCLKNKHLRLCIRHCTLITRRR